MADVIAEGVVRVGVEDNTATELARIDAEYKSAMDKIGREKATVEIKGNIDDLKAKIADAKARLAELQAAERAEAERNAGLSAQQKSASTRRLQDLASEKRALQDVLAEDQKRLSNSNQQLAAQRKLNQEATLAERARAAATKAEQDASRVRATSDAAALKAQQDMTRARLSDIAAQREAISLQRQYEDAQKRVNEVTKELARAKPGTATADRVKVDQRDALLQMEELRAKLDAMGRNAVDQKVKLDTSAASKAWNIWTKGTLDGKETKTTLDDLGTQIGKLFSTRLNIGPITASIGGMVAALGTLAPIIGSLAGAFLSLISVAGAGLVGALGLGGAAMSGFGLASIGMLGALHPLIQQLQTAHTAMNRYQTVVAQYGAKSTQAKRAQQELNNTLAALPRPIQQVVKDLETLDNRWQALTHHAAMQAFGTAAHAALRTVSADMGFFARDTNNALKATSQGFASWMRDLRSNDARRILDNIFTNFNKSIPSIMHGIEQIGAAFGRWFSTMSNYLPGAARAFSNWATHIDDAAKRTHGWASEAPRLLDALKAIIGLTGAAGKVLLAFFGAGVRPGTNWVDEMSNSLNRLAKRMSSVEGQRKLSDFFGQSISVTKQVFDALQPLLAVFVHLATLFAPLAKAMLPIIEFFTKLAASITGALGPLGKIIVDIAAFVAVGRILGSLGAVVGIFGLLKRGAGEARVAILAARDAIEAFAGASGNIQGVKDAWSVWKNRGGAAAGAASGATPAAEMGSAIEESSKVGAASMGAGITTAGEEAGVAMGAEIRAAAEGTTVVGTEVSGAAAGSEVEASLALGGTTAGTEIASAMEAAGAAVSAEIAAGMERAALGVAAEQRAAGLTSGLGGAASQAGGTALAGEAGAAGAIGREAGAATSEVTGLEGAVGGLEAGAGGAAGGLSGLVAGIAGMAGPITLGVAGVAALAGGIYLLTRNSNDYAGSAKQVASAVRETGTAVHNAMGWTQDYYHAQVQVKDNSLQLKSVNQSIASTTAELNRLTAEGKTNTQAYRDALASLNSELDQRHNIQVSNAQAQQREITTQNELISTNQKALKTANSQASAAQTNLDHTKQWISEGLLRGADATSHLASATATLEKAQRNQYVAQNNVLLGQVNLQRLQRGLPAIMGATTSQTEKYASQLRSLYDLTSKNAKARAFVLSIPNPDQLLQLQRSIAQVGNNPKDLTRVLRILANSKTADDAIRGINGIVIHNKTIKVAADLGNAVRSLAQLQGVKLSPKDQKVLTSGSPQAIAQLAQLRGIQLSPKILRILGDLSGAQRAHNQVQQMNDIQKLLKILGNASSAQNAIGSVISGLAGIQDKYVNIHVGAIVSAAAAKFGGFARGGIPAFAVGGIPGHQDGTNTPSSGLSVNPNTLSVDDWQKIFYQALVGAMQQPTGGGMYSKPTFLVGEENMPEFVIATNPAYRDRNKVLVQQAAEALGMQAFAHGGKPNYWHELPPPNGNVRFGPHGVGNIPPGKLGLNIPPEATVGGLGNQDLEDYMTVTNTAEQKVKSGNLKRILQGEYDWMRSIQKADDRAQTHWTNLQNAINNTALNASTAENAIGQRAPGLNYTGSGGVDHPAHATKSWADWKADQVKLLKEQIRWADTALSKTRAALSFLPSNDSAKSNIISYFQGITTQDRNAISGLTATAAPTPTDINTYLASVMGNEPVGTITAQGGQSVQVGGNDTLANLIARWNYAFSVAQQDNVPDNPATPQREDIDSLKNDLAAAQGLMGAYSTAYTTATKDPRVSRNIPLLQTLSDAYVQARQTYQNLDQQIQAAASVMGPTQDQTYDTARGSLYKSFAGNIAPAITGGSAAAAQLSAASNPATWMGSSPVTSPSAGSSVHITNNYLRQPDDPHTWSQGLAWELGAALP